MLVFNGFRGISKHRENKLGRVAYDESASLVPSALVKKELTDVASGRVTQVTHTSSGVRSTRTALERLHMTQLLVRRRLLLPTTLLLSISARAVARIGSALHA